MSVPYFVVANEIRLLNGPEAVPPWLTMVKVTEILSPGIIELGSKLTSFTVRSDWPGTIVGFSVSSVAFVVTCGCSGGVDDPLQLDVNIMVTKSPIETQIIMKFFMKRSSQKEYLIRKCSPNNKTSMVTCK